MKMSDNAESPTETPKEESQSPPDDSTTTEEKKKIDVLLKAVGDTPIMKTKKWAVDRGRTVQSLAQFIARFLKFDANEQLLIYVNQSFAPSPDQDVGVLFDEKQRVYTTQICLFDIHYLLKMPSASKKEALFWQ